MVAVAARGSTSGKRAGARRGARQKRRFDPRVLGLALGITLAVIAWGYLVYTAIDFGSDARGGDNRAWGYLALAAVGAVACLFIGLMLVARLSRSIGLTAGPPPKVEPSPVEPVEPVAGGATVDGSGHASSQASSSHRHRAG